MKKHFKATIISIVALSILTGGGYGAWFAWDNGLIGKNPRAPVAAAMEEAVRKQALVNINTREASEPCINLDLSRPSPEVAGFTGIALSPVPGRYAVTLLRQTNIREQPARDIQLGQMDYLSAQGFFTAADSIVDTDGGTSPARTYQLTWEGYTNNHQNYGSALCFNYGQREFAGIEKIEKLLEKVMGLDVYEVTYLSKQVNPPAWVRSPEAKRWFPKLQQLTEDSKNHVKVIRTKDGWRSAYEIELEAAQAAKGQTTGNNYLQEMMKNLSRQPPTLEEAKQLIAGQTVDANWILRNGIACLPLQLQRGGDDKPVPGNVRPPETSTPFTVTYYDRTDRKEYEYRMMLKTLHVLSALEYAGFAKMEYIKPVLRKNNKAAQNSIPSTPDEQNGGVQYVLSREAAEALGISSYGGGCIPAGRIKIDLIAMQGNRGMVQIKARGMVEQTPDWAVKIGEKLPALKSLIENGMQMSGQMNFATSEGEGKWRLDGLMPGYPEMNYEALPAHLIPVMPHTTAAFPPKPVKAPALVQQSTNSLDQGQALPGTFLPPARALAAAPSAMQPVAQQAMPVPTSQRPAPYPAEGAPVHVVSIYQALQPKGAQRDAQQHPEGVVNLNVKEDHAVLLLLAYEPVEWHIVADRGIDLKRVIAIGYYEPRVTFSGGGKPQVIVTRSAEVRQRMGIALKNGFPTRIEANDLIDIAAASRALTDALPRTYQANYEAPASGFTISSQTPGFVLPPPQAPSPKGSPITLRSAFTEAVAGNKLQRGTSGAYTDAWSDRAYSAGKIYYEGKMKVTGSLAAHTHANIGLCLVRGNTIDVPSPGGSTVIRHGEQKLFKEGDVFGIAADFDQQRLYFRVNGKWLSGQPESGNGFPLERGKEYRACVLAAGTVSGEVKQGIPRSDTTWEINFGEAPFQSPIPSGYVSFRGGR